MEPSATFPAPWAYLATRLVVVLSTLRADLGVVQLHFYPVGIDTEQLRPTAVWSAGGEDAPWEISSGLGSSKSSARTVEEASLHLIGALRSRVASPDALMLGDLNQRERLVLARVAPDLAQGPIDERERRRERVSSAPDARDIPVDEAFSLPPELEPDPTTPAPHHDPEPASGSPTPDDGRPHLRVVTRRLAPEDTPTEAIDPPDGRAHGELAALVAQCVELARVAFRRGRTELTERLERTARQAPELDANEARSLVEEATKALELPWEARPSSSTEPRTPAFRSRADGGEDASQPPSGAPAREVGGRPAWMTEVASAGNEHGHPLPAPQAFGPYAATAVLASGGGGTVYSARRGDHPVATIIKAAHVGSDLSSAERLGREATALRALGGVHAPRFYDADPADPPSWILTERVPGITLGEAVTRFGPADAGSLALLGQRLFEALAAVHELGLLHRDLKPSNVMMGDRLYIIDFGLVRSEEMWTLTPHDVVLGTLGYLAPELVRGEGVGTAADVWSAALVIGYVATARPPFAAGGTFANLLQIVDGEADLDGTPDDVFALLEPCLDPDPDRRPPAAELAEQFRQLESSPPTAHLPRAAPLTASNQTHSPGELRAADVEVAGSQTGRHAPPAQPQRLLRNDPCPCGSGRKATRCHG